MNNFLYFSTKTYLEWSVEPSHWDGFNEVSQRTFLLRNRKNSQNYLKKAALIWSSAPAAMSDTYIVSSSIYQKFINH